MVETGEREVFFQVNGQLRSMKVKDKAAIKDQKVHPKADKSKKTQIGNFLFLLKNIFRIIFVNIKVHQCPVKY